MRSTTHRRIPALLLTATLVSTAGLSLAGPAHADPATTYGVSGPTVTVTGTSVTATTAVTASAPTTAAYAGVCARGAKGANTDFPKQRDVALGAEPTDLTVTQDLAPGTYSLWTCLYVDGRWHGVGSRQTVTVEGDASGEPGPAPKPAPARPPQAKPGTGRVVPALETPVLAGSGDIADDPAVWVDPVDASRSVVVATSKAGSGGGVVVYDLAGRRLQFRADGRMNNVDLRSGVVLGGRSSTVVVASNRTSRTLAFYRLDPVTRQVSPVGARSVSTGFEPYGLAMYRSKVSGKTFVFVSEEDGSRVDQFELRDSGGLVDAVRVRSITVGSLSEGLVADDELGHLYVAEEDRGIWRYGAEPGAGVARVAIGRVGDGHLRADVEGLGLAVRGEGGGHLIASSQGSSTFEVYDRRSGAWAGSFSVGGSSTVDGVSDTDGLDVTTVGLGAAFPQGLLVVHDASNTGGATSNYKFVDLGQVLAAVAGG